MSWYSIKSASGPAEVNDKLIVKHWKMWMYKDPIIHCVSLCLCLFPWCIYSLVILVVGSDWRIPWLSLQTSEQFVHLKKRGHNPIFSATKGLYLPLPNRVCMKYVHYSILLLHLKTVVPVSPHYSAFSWNVQKTLENSYENYSVFRW